MQGGGGGGVAIQAKPDEILSKEKESLQNPLECQVQYLYLSKQ